jgi:hypothetical protein
MVLVLMVAGNAMQANKGAKTCLPGAYFDVVRYWLRAILPMTAKPNFE